MMRALLFQFSLACVALALAGCRQTVKPGPGLAALRVKVVAEPKTGVPAEDTSGSGYDSGGNRPPPAFETLDYSDLPDVVVWLEPTSGPAIPPAVLPDANVDVNPERPAATSVIAVSVGEKVIFHNTGPRAGGIYSVSDGNEFSVASVPPDGTAACTVRWPGPIEVLSDPARGPIAELYAAPSRWALTARSGTQVVFNNVPPGDYRLVSWHPRLPGSQTAVSLSAGAVSDATIKVGVNDLPKVNDK
jgi:hypothetical protein